MSDGASVEPGSRWLDPLRSDCDIDLLQLVRHTDECRKLFAGEPKAAASRAPVHLVALMGEGDEGGGVERASLRSDGVH